MTHAANTLSLVADIGGTNTRVALARGADLLPDTIRRYRNADCPDLETAIRRFIQDQGGVDCAAACVAVAGPVRDGRATMTNLDWTIDTDTLARATGAQRVAILNDLQAQGHALGRIAADKLRPLIAATPEAGAPQLVIGVGTGFNAATVYHDGATRLVTASESGHITLPIRSGDDLALSTFVGDSHGFPALEEVLSGRGLSNVDAWVGAQTGATDRRDGGAIMAALDTGEPRAKTAVDTFIRLLGNAAGDLSLIHLPRGGIYLIGGVARAVAPHFEAAGFIQAFRDKGRFGPFMEAFPVWLIEDDYAALIGVAAYLAQAG